MTPASKEYKTPQLLGDEQSRLIRMEAMAEGVEKLMTKLDEKLDAMNEKLIAIENSRTEMSMQSKQDHEAIIDLKSKLDAACTKITGLETANASYKLTASVLCWVAGGLFAIAFSCVGWAFITIMGINTQQSINTSKLQRVDSDVTALNQRTSELERKKVQEGSP